MVDTGDAVIRVRRGGDEPPILLLHGHPQIHVMWHKIAPRLSRDFTVVAVDLRGYGQSSKPPSTSDQVAVMRHFGFDEFAVVGHDRGGRCA
jgi:haloacetate dehalogenase